MNRLVGEDTNNGEACPTYKVGSTYEHKNLDTEITHDAQVDIKKHLNRLIKIQNYEVIRQQAGVRPATRDQRPFIGLHPQYSQIGIFNGFGAKGVSLTPYLAKRFVDFLEKGEEIPTEANITRFQIFFDKD